MTFLFSHIECAKVYSFNDFYHLLMHVFKTHVWCSKPIASHGDVMTNLAFISACLGLIFQWRTPARSDDKEWRIWTRRPRSPWQSALNAVAVHTIHLGKLTALVAPFYSIRHVSSITGVTQVSWFVWCGVKPHWLSNFTHLSNFAQFHVRS